MKIVDWNEFTGLLDQLSKEVALHTFDNIVAIGRGGSIIGAYLASKLGLPAFVPVFVRHVGRGKEMKIVLNDAGQVKRPKGRLLVVDDWLCEGRAMTFVLDMLPKSASATTLVMFDRNGSEFTPDFVGAYLDEKERDIMFPYDT